ncbi:Zn-dependent amino-or carboxypeptidase, M28 family [Jatrophihabitans endophyticus]|uniref:Zn-dependent amino-or carboxypeptidase, M28 family n=1 Tax=Jatrophihabitans endophyticus TaxID=1206085 RepID=A0A1M5CR62_9ACTN|nr:MFS transporter [Jatrophihabitans endophyticus]SHF57241.1 Zn-dependent amino-or carboxypeptidase, M28 family [Jatrophihabitans endophyticus]
MSSTHDPDAPADATPARTAWPRSFRLLAYASLISGLGDGARFAALPLLATTITGNTLLVAAVTIAGQLPLLLVGPVAGVVVDRSDRARQLWRTATVQAVVMGVFAALVIAGSSGIWIILVASFVLAATETLSFNLQAAAVPDLVPPQRLPAANSIVQGAQFVASDLVGIAIGSLLFSWHPTAPFVVDAVSFALAAALLGGVRLRRRGPTATATATAAPTKVSVASVRSDIVFGVRWLWSHRLLRALCLVTALGNFVVISILSIAVLFALKVLGVTAAVYGLLMAVIAVGGLVGLLLAPLIDRAVGPGRALQLTFGIAPLPTLVVGLTDSPVVASIALFFVSGSVSIGNVVSVSVRQSVVPRELFGRVNASFRLLASGFGPAAGAVAGGLAEAFGLHAPFLFGALVFLVGAVIGALAISNTAIEHGRSARVDADGDGDGDDATGPVVDEVLAPAERPVDTPALRHRLAAAGLVLVLAALVVVQTAGLRLPDSPPRTVGAGTFSGQRAVDTIGRLAHLHRTIGKPGNDEARAAIVAGFTRLGLHPTVTTRTAAVSSADTTHAVGTVSDIVTMVRGSDPTGTVVVDAHYDSVPTGFGAVDDLLNVGVVHELARALTHGERPRNNIVFLVADGEEEGSLGAKAFVDAHLVDPARTVVLNLEARGTNGPAVMFQTVGRRVGHALDALGRGTITATSVSNEVYRLLPNDTDLTVFGDHGYSGLNFALIGGSPDYHTPHDDATRLHPGAAQAMGDATLGPLRYLSTADLRHDATGSRTYFSTTWSTIDWPHWLDFVICPLAVALLLGLVGGGGRLGLRRRSIGKAAAGFALPVLGSGILAFGVWYVETAVKPELLQFTSGDTYHPATTIAGLAIGGAALLVLWYRWMRRTARPLEIVVGILCWLAGLGVVLLVVAPTASYIVAVPALIGGLLALVTAAVTTPESAWRPLAGAGIVVVPVLLMYPVVSLLFPTLGLSLAAPGLIFGVLAFAGLAALLELVPRAGLRVLTPLTGVAAVAVLVLGYAIDGTDARHPRSVSIGYAVDGDTGTARWVSDAPVADPAIASLVPRSANLATEFPSLADRTFLVGPASRSAALTPIRLTGSAVHAEPGGRAAVFTVRPPAGTESTYVYAHVASGVSVRSAVAGGQRLPGGTNRSFAPGGWTWGFRFSGVHRDGIPVTLHLGGTGPIQVRVVAEQAGLPAVAGAPTLPKDASFSPWPSVAGQSIIVGTFDLTP